MIFEDENTYVEILVTMKHDGRPSTMDPHDGNILYPIDKNIIEIR